MEIELDQDIKFKNFNFSIIDNNYNNNRNFNHNSKEPLLSTNESNSLSFSNNNNKIKYCFNMSNNSKFSYKRIISEKNYIPIISSCERRLIKDIEELKKNENIGKFCQVKFNEYSRIKYTDNFQMIIEFKNFFSVKFVFLPDYPFSPPIISFNSGIKYSNIFDSEGNILLENIKKEKWTPTLWISTLVRSIELLISKNQDQINNIDCNSKNIVYSKIMKYSKRNWDNYLMEEKAIFKNDQSIINQLTKSIKEIKPLVI